MFDATQYWNERLEEKPALQAVGNVAQSVLFNQFMYRAKVRTAKRALNKLQIDVTGINALDIGSGTGFWIDFLMAKGAQSVSGVDISDQAVQLLRHKYRDEPCVTLYCCNIGDDSLPVQEQFDFVTAFDVLYHIVDHDLFQRAVQNLSSVLSSGGYFFFTDSLIDRSPAPHVQYRPLARYQTIFQENNLELVLVKPMYMLLNNPNRLEGSISGVILKTLFRLTNRVSRLPILSHAYLWGLYLVDSLLTRLVSWGPSTHLLVARKRQSTENQ